MLRSKEIIVPIIVALLLIAIPVWMIASYYGQYAFYKDLSDNGIKTGARLDNKQITADESGIFNLFVMDSKENYMFKVGFVLNQNEYTRCTFGVSKDTYYSIGVRDELRIVYSPSNPSNCTLTDGIDISRFILQLTLGFALFILLLGLGFIYYIYNSYKKPSSDKLVKPTTDMSLSETELACPKCNNSMTEGYMPTVGGVAWRDSDEPIGIPTMLTGLPGTTFWVKRPLLHAYHCKKCKIITFKYGQDS